MKPVQMTKNEIVSLLKGADDEGLFNEADLTRRRIFGSNVYLRGVVEFSNHCVNRCLYCGLRASNHRVVRYRMVREEIVEAAVSARKLGVGTVVLQSGDDYRYTKSTVGTIITAIKSEIDVAVTLSLGDRTEEELKFWRECGADRYLLKIETFNKELYEKLRPGCDIKDRLRRIELLRRLGYEVGSGVITDLPGMTIDLSAHDIARLKELNLDMIACGPFVPHPDTPLGGKSTGSALTALRVVALLRLSNPYANIPSTSALSSASSSARKQALQRGANVLMPSVTPEEIRGRYAIYPGKNAGQSTVEEHISQCKRMIVAAGYAPSSDKGFSPRRNHGQSASRHETGHHNPWPQECGQVVSDQRHNR